MKLHSVSANGIDGSRFAVLDGTLTNRAELCRELNVRDDDADGLVHAAFLRWAEDFPQHLRGTFAAAVFDLDGNRLLLTRDHFGGIPLYVTRAKGQIWFGSRVDDFLERGLVPPVASRQAVWDYLTLGAIPQPQTILAGVSSLRPAEAMIMALDDSGTETRRVWWTPPLHTGQPALSFADATAQLREQLETMAERCLESFGRGRLLLSGGIDSGVLLALLSRHGRGLPTLTLGYETAAAAFDETSQARLLAEHFGAEARYVKVEGWDIAKAFTRFLRSMDQPSRDGLNMYMAASAAHAAGAETVVTGLGGDELFAGYSYVRRHLQAERLAAKLALLRPLGRRLPDRFQHSLALPFMSRAERLATIRAQVTEAAKQRLVNPAFLSGGPLMSWLERCQAAADETLDTATQLSLFDMRLDMDHTLLRDGYHHTAAHGVSLQSPFLTPELAEFALNLPLEAKIRDGQSKAVLLATLKDELPPQFGQAPKHGFEMPLLRWLGGPLLTRAREAFASPQALALFDRQELLNWSERLGALQPRDYPLWSRFILLEWLRLRHIESFA